MTDKRRGPIGSAGYLDDIGSIVSRAFSGDKTGASGVDETRNELIIPAPNAIEWIVRKDLCNVPSLYEMTRQYQVIRDFFQLRCPLCNKGGSEEGQPGDCWNRSREYLESEVLLVWSAAYNDDVCPRCRLTRTELVADGLLRTYNQFHLVCGQRSGKSYTAALIGSYIEHRIYTIAHSYPGGIHAYLGIPSSETFELTFLASNEVQGADTIWAKYRGFRAGSPWFQRYVPWIKSQEAAQLTPIGMAAWAYAEIDKKIVNQHPSVRLICNSLNSNSGGLRGRTRIMAAADELSYMQQTDGKLSADEVYVGLEHSLLTVRAQTSNLNRLPWLGSMLSVSSPKSNDDKSMKLLRAAEDIDDMFAAHYTTWDFNPKITREDLDDEFAKDPIRAERDFGANPPSVAHPLITDWPRFYKLGIGHSAVPTCDMESFAFRDPQAQEYIGIRYNDAKILRDWPRYICFDAGKNFDAFSGACAHGERVYNEDGSSRIVTVFDWVMRILPAQGTEVFFDSVFELVKKLREKQKIVRVEFDRWNSVQIIQQIRGLDIKAEAQPTRDEDYKRFAADAYAGLVQMLPPRDSDIRDDGTWKVDPPFMHPQTCALYELQGMERHPVTDKVTNPRKGERKGWNSNDTIQVCVHVHRLIQDQGYVERQDDQSKRAAIKRSEVDGTLFVTQKQGTVFNPTKGMGGFGRANGRGRGW